MNKKLTICIPNYKRSKELDRCLASIYAQKNKNYNILIHDDCSPNIEEVRCVVDKYKIDFEKENIKLKFIDSSSNIGYDKSLRKLILSADTDYVIFIGNDDVLERECVGVVLNVIDKHASKMYSRNFYKIAGPDGVIVGISKFVRYDKVFSEKNSSPQYAYRLCCYFGGLVLDRKWAASLDNAKYDGTLYYQYYLALNAFSDTGIYCINKPIVGALIDGIPLFSDNDKSGVHTAGRYSVNARVKMWSDVLQITKEYDLREQKKFTKYIANELKNRMSFHVMEMFSNSNRDTLLLLYKEFSKIKLFWSLPSVIFWSINFIFQSYSCYFYKITRKIFQHVKK